MTVGSVTASNGNFMLTQNGVSQAVDLGTLMMMLNLDQTSNLDRQIADQIGEIQTRNGKIKASTEVLTTLRNLKSQGLDDGDPGNLSNSSTVKITVDGVTKYLQGPGSWCEELGINYTDIAGHRPKKDADAKVWDDKMEANIQNVKSAIDMLNNDSQLANIKLQNLLEKRNNAFEMASKVMATNNQSVQSVVRNL